MSSRPPARTAGAPLPNAHPQPGAPKAGQRLKSGRNVRLVLVTAPDLRRARAMARAALEARLVACVNLIPKLESHYWWEGKLEKGAEVLMIFKTTKRQLPALKDLILAAHPYDTAEFAALPLDQVSERYLDWWETEASGTAGPLSRASRS